MRRVISVEGISKKYVIHHGGREPYLALRDVISRAVGSAARVFKKSDRRVQSEEFWALRDVSFDVAQGDRVGIIGRNGAGKSTMLKVLSRITEPTSGRIRIKGRLASLLEVGTGFHPELTGRENIFLNGAVLGMSRSEIAAKFDAIVDFAEVERFLDTPVKRYSSGMYVRLAFAVAAHLEPEILVIDEVLAVGDAQFQKKCLGKMEDVSAREGRTVLFVSHNMAAIQQLCNRAIILDGGRVVDDGHPDQLIDRYLQSVAATAKTRRDLDAAIRALPPDAAFRLIRIDLTQRGEPVDDVVYNGDPLILTVEYEVLERTRGLRVHFDVCDEQGTILIRSFHDELADGMPTVSPGRYTSVASIPANLLGPMTYELVINTSIFNVRYCFPHDAIRLRLHVQNTGIYNRAYPMDTFRARLAPAIPWQTQQT